MMPAPRALLHTSAPAAPAPVVVRPVRQVPLLRACALCVHTAGEQPTGTLMCRAPAALIGQRGGTPCAVARAADGCCGPNAIHLDMAAWRTHRAGPSHQG